MRQMGRSRQFFFKYRPVFLVRAVSFWRRHLQNVGWPTLLKQSTVGLALILAVLPFSNPTARAANYSKTWTSSADFAAGTTSNVTTANNQVKLSSSTGSFNENFSTTTYKDAATTANWNTSTPALTLTANSPSSGTASDLQTKWRQAVGSSETVNAMVYDSTNQFIYLGGSQGSLAAYKPSTQTFTNLTSFISADWNTTTNAMTFDSVNGVVYLGGNTGKFGAFVGGATPSSGTWHYLSSKILADFG